MYMLTATCFDSYTENKGDISSRRLSNNVSLNNITFTVTSMTMQYTGWSKKSDNPVLKSVYIYGSYRKIKTGLSLFWTTL